jgi:hypothetical protein
MMRRRKRKRMLKPSNNDWNAWLNEEPRQQNYSPYVFDFLQVVTNQTSFANRNKTRKTTMTTTKAVMPIAMRLQKNDESEKNAK